MNLAAPGADTLENTLCRALNPEHARWQAGRREGMTDAQLREAIAERFGIYGGFSGPGYAGCAYKGGANPAFYGEDERKRKPTLIGKPLLEAARRVLCIPLPGQRFQPPAIQLGLFDID